eukprot:2168784-Amphidinium_carterae.1
MAMYLVYHYFELARAVRKVHFFGVVALGYQCWILYCVGCSKLKAGSNLLVSGFASRYGLMNAIKVISLLQLWQLGRSCSWSQALALARAWLILHSMLQEDL